MTEKKSHVHDSVEAKGELPETKVNVKQGESPKIQKKGCVDRCLENPGFPWMIIAILFSLLVVMFWKDHYYNFYRMRGGNVFYKEWSTGDDHSGPMMDRGERMRRSEQALTPIEQK